MELGSTAVGQIVGEGIRLSIPAASAKVTNIIAQTFAKVAGGTIAASAVVELIMFIYRFYSFVSSLNCPDL